MLIIKGIIYLIRGIPLAIIIYAVLLSLLWISKKRRSMRFKIMILEFVFILYIITILEITGIIGMQFNIDWFKNSLLSIGLYTPSSKGELMMMVLNMVLFVPLGILLPIRKKWNGIKVLVFGISFSVGIEILQMFGGRMSELNDVLLNSLGVLMGYWIFQIYKYICKVKYKTT